MQRTLIQELKSEKEVLLKGWVYEIRALAKLSFILLKDISGIIQCVALKPELMKKISEISLESVVEIKGKTKKANVKAELARSDIEIEIESLEVINKAEALPIHVNEKTTTTEFATRLDYRFLDFHKPKIQAIFKIQNVIENSFREFFYQKNYLEMQPPCIISAASEGGTDLFEVKYFEKKAYLAQSPQLYKQMIACSMEKTFMITPVWRAEKHNTTRHINEIRQMDIECAFMNQTEIMKELEEVVKFIVKKVLEKCSKELEILGVKDLKIPKGVYLHYEDAIKKVGGKVGEDFTPEEERKLCEMYKGDIVFAHSWPASIKPFYIMPTNENPKSKESQGFDALYGGMEISSGGQRVHIPEILTAKIKEKGLNPKNFKDYIDSFRYGAPYHSGWSIGLERLTQIICGLDNVKEATMFPRDRTRLTP
ncbi:aspartate--tRNA(Asn) ligase [Candidatus Pacearchaeota archaeon]|nr:aspartate--tRNA(Asn) ligase [Candidatus Pacearchaeota archaeon]